MPTHQKHLEKKAIYFVTFTCYKWLPLFKKSDAYNQVYQWFSYIKEEVKILGYVIMRNHLHVLLYLNSKERTLNKIVAEGKRFMAYYMVKQLKAKKEDQLLKTLQGGVSIKQQEKGKKHRVFRLSFDAKQCYSEEKILHVLDYMHENPVSKKWSLVSDYVDYKHSSASFYLLNKPGPFPVTHYRDIWEIN